MADSKSDLDQARRIMGALVRMPPKPHDEMKLGTRKPKDKTIGRIYRIAVRKSGDRSE
jgi:hypothetical protein